MARKEYPMIEDLTRAEYDALLRTDFALFAARCFHDLNPQTELGRGPSNGSSVAGDPRDCERGAGRLEGAQRWSRPNFDWFLN
jgi:hypothetical protein